jgi:putative transposase
MKELPVRKSHRMKEYEYSQSGYYFVTFRTFHNNGYLGKIEGSTIDRKSDKVMALNKNGLIVEFFIKSLEKRYENMLVEQYCIMPNHVHLLIAITDDSSILPVGAVQEPPAAETMPPSAASKTHRSLLSNAVGYLKMNSAKQIRFKNPYISVVWQRAYHDRIVRNEAELIRIKQYMRENPKRWLVDVFFKDEIK